MKRKVMIAVLILLVMAAGTVGIIYFSDGGDYPISVTGNLSTNDVKDIKAVVRDHLRKEIIPDISWTSIKGLPMAVRTYSKTYVLTIISVTNDVSEQWVSCLWASMIPMEFPHRWDLTSGSGVEQTGGNGSGN